MPDAIPEDEPWDRTSRPTIKGNIVIAFMFIIAVIAVFGLLAVAYGTETRDSFSR